MTALLIEDVTLTKGEEITINIRFRGGRCQTLSIPAPIRECDRLRTKPDIVAQIDILLSEHSDGENAAILNQQGLKTAAGDAFTTKNIGWIKSSRHLMSLRQRLRQKGMLTSGEMAKKLGLTRNPVMRLRRLGQLRARKSHDRGRWVFWPLDRQPNLDAATINLKKGDETTDAGTTTAKGAV